MAAAPLVSVVTVSLNAAHTITDTIASVSKQRTSFQLEHICVDGGSTDGTRNLIDEWASGSEHIVRIYEPDTGIFDAMNKGLAAARGEYILFLNADDFLVAPDSIASAMQGIDRPDSIHPDLVVGDVVVGDPGAWGLWRHLRVPRLLGRLRGWGLFPLHQGQFARRSLLEAVGGFQSSLRSAADVTQYFDIERRLHPSIRRLNRDVSLMRAGGKSNQGIGGRYRGVREMYGWLRQSYSAPRAIAISILKSSQTLLGLRMGRCPHRRWFAD